ncbi:MAG TPA: hypothetical protein VN670_09345 [Acidobacteriaceae bacterium]|nr:hypothetical protein [Acidobacteriaceae bacterium]
MARRYGNMPHAGVGPMTLGRYMVAMRPIRHGGFAMIPGLTAYGRLGRNCQDSAGEQQENGDEEKSSNGPR